MESLIQNDTLPTQDQVPAYLLAADNHNLGNTRGGSWLDPTTWGDKFEGAGKLISTGVLSGANSFYNTGIAIGNWFGAGAEERDTQSFISGIDSDLGAYYSNNREAADLVGFIAGSFIPGLGGIKVLNAGQTALKVASKTGLLGENLSKATGLLIPQTDKYIKLAAADINAASATFSSINANGIKALASGVYQNVLEGAAFETAVQATMFKSPILSEQDNWDIVKNIAIGGVFQGVLGGAFAGAKSLGVIKSLVKKEEGFLKPLSSRNLPQEGTSPADSIILMAEDRDLAAQPFPTSDNFPQAQKTYTDKIRRIDNDIRTEAHNITKGDDPEIGNMLADSIYGLDHQTILDNLLHTTQAGRLNQTLDVESKLAKSVKAGEPIDPNLQVQYIKLTGEGAGAVQDTKPLVSNLADTHAGEKGVLSAVRDYGFKLDKSWNPLSLTTANGHLEAEARYIWADRLLKEIPDKSLINQNDIPLLERAYRDNQLNIILSDGEGNVLKDGFTSKQDLWNHLITTKNLIANELLRTKVLEGTTPVELGTVRAAKIVNTKIGRLEGDALGPDTKDYLSWQTGKDDYQSFLENKGLKTPANESADPRFLPTYLKIGKQVPDIYADINGTVTDGMTWIKQQQKMLQLGIDNVVAKATGSLYPLLPTITDSSLLTSNRYGSGAKLFSYSNGGYGSLESTAQLSGSVARQLKQQFRQVTSDSFSGPLTNLGNSQEAAIEWETINQKISRSGKLWVRTEDEAGNQYLITRDNQKLMAAPDFDFTDVPEEELIQIKTPQAVTLSDAHIARTGQRTSTWKELNSAFGKTDVKDPDVFRPIRPNPQDYPFFAFVKDPKVTGTGHSTMIFANSESKLADLINKVPSAYQVVTKRDAEEFFQARNEYEYSRTLHENYINPELKNAGVYSEFFTKTDPQKIVNDFLQQHLREDDTLGTELIRAKNRNAFDWLEDQGNAYSKISASRFGSGISEKLSRTGTNPYLDYIKTALDISKISEYPLLKGFNTFLDSAVSKVVGGVSDLFSTAKSPADLESINKYIDSFGMNTGYRDAATDLLVNHPAPKGELTKFVRGANAILAKLTLGLDPLNAVNNFIGANILRSTELKQITDAIKSGDTELGGQLAKLTKVELPGGVGAITSPGKLIAGAIRNYFQDDGTLVRRYQQAGFIKDATQQFKDILDDFTLKGTESVSDLSSRMARAFDRAKQISEVGEKYTGNKFAEQFNRFISADVMRQLTDLGVNKGLLTPAEQTAYINTFVNRVEGNTLASQRPLMFQGPIGQAIGLFQSYQFNLMQQMFRYVSEGTAKDAAMLLGLQSTFYGIQGLPAFQFINQHVVGTLSGNSNHRDIYDATYGIAGRQVADLLLYGLPSDLLRTNIYSRGDINPRQVTIIPTSLPEVPFIGAFGKFLSSVKDSVDKISQGGNVWESMLQGLEHNGLSRPLAGMAQTFQGLATPTGNPFSTTSKGSILFSNDFMSWATAVRLAGGRPLDEAIINDGVFRVQSYHQYDLAKMANLGEAIKSSGIQGFTPSDDQIVQFSKEYAQNGGKQVQFNKWMINQIKSANTSQSEKIVHQLNNPLAQKMQLLMGGDSDTSLSTSQ